MLRGAEIDEDRLWTYMLNHPDRAPAELTMPRLVENPSVFARTAKWQRFLDTIRSYAERWPDDPDWPRFIPCLEAGLAYRATVPPDYRFWTDAEKEQE